MAHNVSEVLGEGNTVKIVQSQPQQQSAAHQPQTQPTARKSVGVMGSRRIFAPSFKLRVLDSYRNDIDCRGNQRATARKYGIHRRQIQKWLQCEDNLRNSCAEANGNANGVVSSAVIPSASVSKPDGTVTEATGPAVTPAAPALNLSLARLHGDELASQQGPPPLVPRASHGGSPSSPQYVAQSTAAAVMPVRVGYQEYSTNQEQQVSESVHNYTEQEQSRYYVINNTDEPREIENPPTFDSREVKVYQNLTSYRGQERRYEANEVINNHIHHQSPSQNRSQSYGDMDSSPDRKSSCGLLLAPSMIKTERASPDSAATPGPCKPTCSPGAPRGPLSPGSHIPSSNSSSSSSSGFTIHFDSPRASASPGLHVHVHAHTSPAPSPSPDSEKPGDSNEIKEKDTAVMEIGKALIKEELHIEEEPEVNEDGRETVAASYNYQRPPADSLPVSPVHDREGYSLSSSPRIPTSSGRSSTSSSDSEIDPLDCSSGNQNSSNDLAHRRSFSLRFKLDVLDAFYRHAGVAGNQRATARKFGIHRRQVQKWLGQETELRGEIAVRGNSRQRLGPVQDAAASGESPVDLRTSNCVSTLSQDRIEAEYEPSPPPFYCCDVGSSSSSSSASHFPYYQHPMVGDASDTEPAAACNLSCCVDSSHATTPITLCYQEVSLRGSCYPDLHYRQYCYSPREYPFEMNAFESAEELPTSPSKRLRCNLSCCHEAAPSPKRLCVESEEYVIRTSPCQGIPPQETPLCLVKPKRFMDASPTRIEPVTSTVPTPPSSAVSPPGPTTASQDGILFKPYLDIPVSKPAKDPQVQRDLSPVSNQNVHNNNCQNICNLNEARSHDYALELSLRLPLTWRTHPSSYEFPQIRSAFARYPASPHYT